MTTHTVVITPASNRDCLKLLIPQIQHFRDFVDEYRLFINTKDPDDIKFIKDQAKIDPDFIKIVDTLMGGTDDPDTVYIKIDNNIVLLDVESSFKNFINFRIEHPEYSFIYGNILNNAIVTYLHQQSGKLKPNQGTVKKVWNDMNGYRNVNVAIDIHEQVLKTKNLKNFYFEPIDTSDIISDNFVSWLGGSGCSKSRPNCIFGNFVCVNYAFSTQKMLMDTTDILSRYSTYYNKFDKFIHNIPKCTNVNKLHEQICLLGLERNTHFEGHYLYDCLKIREGGIDQHPMELATLLWQGTLKEATGNEYVYFVMNEFIKYYLRN